MSKLGSYQSFSGEFQDEAIFNQDFLDLLHALLEVKARFMIVDAFALSIHAEPRATGDLDIWVESTPENAEKVYRALKQFGAPLVDLTQDDLATVNVVFQIGLPPNRIDLLTSISGVQFSEAWKRHITFDLSGKQIPIIGKEDLICNKQAAGRPKDLIDLQILKK